MLPIGLLLIDTIFDKFNFTLFVLQLLMKTDVNSSLNLFKPDISWIKMQSQMGYHRIKSQAQVSI